MKKLFIACLGTETNTFSNIPTNYQSFEQAGMARGDEIFYQESGELKTEAR